MGKFRFVTKYGLFISIIITFLFFGLIVYSQGYMVYSELSIILTIMGYIGVFLSFIGMNIVSRYKYYRWETEKNVIEGQMTFKHNYLYVNGELKDESCEIIKRRAPLLKAYCNDQEIVVGYSGHNLSCFVNGVMMVKYL